MADQEVWTWSSGLLRSLRVDRTVGQFRNQQSHGNPKIWTMPGKDDPTESRATTSGGRELRDTGKEEKCGVTPGPKCIRVKPVGVQMQPPALAGCDSLTGLFGPQHFCCCFISALDGTQFYRFNKCPCHLVSHQSSTVCPEYALSEPSIYPL